MNVSIDDMKSKAEKTEKKNREEIDSFKDEFYDLEVKFFRLK